jgi:hypothetical protein
MKILLINFFGTMLFVAFDEPTAGRLSQRLAALRHWATQRNYVSRCL